MAETSGAKSPVETRLNLGRGSVRRPQRDHQGRRSDSTAHKALENVERGGQQRNPTDTEMQDVFRANPDSFRALKAARLSNLEIYEILSRNT